MRSILIAGGAGFIGSHLCEYLLHRGDRIICLDNFRTGHPKNVSALTNHPYFKLVEHDITMPYMIKGIDGIYNLACPASPIHYQDSPIETIASSSKPPLAKSTATRKSIPNPKVIGGTSTRTASVPVMMWANVVPKAFVWIIIEDMAWR